MANNRGNNVCGGFWFANFVNIKMLVRRIKNASFYTSCKQHRKIKLISVLQHICDNNFDPNSFFVTFLFTFTVPESIQLKKKNRPL